MSTTPSSPGLRERKKARTRATIQREALRLFTRDGYATTSVEQIAASAEISPSTFFRYFPTKEDVVLADFLDEDTVERFVEAPAELSLLGALGHAIRVGLGELGDEDLALERTRNELIRTVPELRRGQLAEIVRPMQLFAEGVARRTGRDLEDPDVRMYAGAVIGAMVLVSPEMLANTLPAIPADPVTAVIERLERLEGLVVLPPPPPRTRTQTGA